ncbi:hypothetical protein HDU97_008098 [Phlyctochytrium planicorne]|nr:hypothetical protein HDU97_008098 [Phlyctochytrium planicorne]
MAIACLAASVAADYGKSDDNKAPISDISAHPHPTGYPTDRPQPPSDRPDHTKYPHTKTDGSDDDDSDEHPDHPPHPKNGTEYPHPTGSDRPERPKPTGTDGAYGHPENTDDAAYAPPPASDVAPVADNGAYSTLAPTIPATKAPVTANNLYASDAMAVKGFGGLAVAVAAALFF